ncbi:hypothetical protein L873DRAFT_660169 [Choiromyces venosus 120613-1]|uniref:Uncharacterized protein n=1 Tax=Choiromyces venosus 120613-1 TaxID=1336337 RepID=A0A3N4IYL2_9PEZI|nr:hypothetical protein L873DRAFT_660169 [Choiromyces venosus 120613-1]
MPTPVQKHSRRDLPAVAEFVLSRKCQKIVFLYWNPHLRWPPNSNPHREAAFDISFFCTNPQPFYTLAKISTPWPIHPNSRARLHITNGKEKIAAKCFTQNIDTLEHAAGVLLKWPIKARRSTGWYTGGVVHRLSRYIPG